MANQIVTIQVQSKDGKLVVDSRLIAEDLGIKHKVLLNTVRKYQERIESNFGQLLFRKAVESKSNNPEVFCWLTEDQATFVMTLSRNSDRVLDCKAKLVKAFSAAKKLLQQKFNAEWLEMRASGKRTRREETDAIKEFIEYAQLQGSESAARYYCNITKMQNKALFLVEQEYPNLRDVLDIQQLGILGVADSIVRKALHDGMKQGLYYKDIYKLAKQNVEALAEVHGKVLVPSNAKQITDG